jgi:hypothetical protein
MSRLPIAFVAALALLVAAVYILMASPTPLSTTAAVGSGTAFVLGWLVMAYAGNAVVQTMRRRRADRAAVVPIPTHPSERD